MTRAQKILEHIKHLSSDAYKVQQDKVRRLNVHNLMQDQENIINHSMKPIKDTNKSTHSGGVLT